MISCERCGHEMPDNAAICPACGTITSTARSAQQPATEYGRPGSHNDPPQPAGSYGQGYGQQPFGNNFPPQPGYAPPQPGYGQQPFGNNFPPQPGYAPPQPGYGQQPFGAQQQQGYGYAPPMYSPGVVNVNVINSPAQAKNTTALIAEIICSFFGIYGVGWLMSGETTVGAILLVCSIIVLWPVAIVLTITVIGLLCLIPLGIGLFILNIILLNSKLDRKAAQAQMMVQTPIR